MGPDVELGEHCELISHVVIHGPTQMGTHNRFFPFSAIGIAPQDLSYNGERTSLQIGSHNTFRECVTINRGTIKGGGVTTIGNHVLFMACTHVGHDSVVGDHAMMINGAVLAGHVIVEEWAVVGAMCAVHQFCRVGAHSYIGAGTMTTKDVLPYSKTVSPRDTGVYGVNAIGLERRGFSKERVGKIQRAFRVLVASRLNTTQAVEKLKAEGDPGEDVALLIRFIEQSERGVFK